MYTSLKPAIMIERPSAKTLKRPVSFTLEKEKRSKLYISIRENSLAHSDSATSCLLQTYEKMLIQS